MLNSKILLTFLESLKTFLINMVTILTMSAKMATQGLLKIKKGFLRKGYDVIIFVHDVTNKILSCDSNHIVNVVMWSKFGNSSISVKEVIITSILKWFDKKNRFFEGWSWFKFDNLGLALVTNFKFYTSMAKGLKVKVRRFWGLISTFA